MNNFVQPGKSLTATAPYDRLSGQGAKIGTMFGVATVDVLSGAQAEFQMDGVIDLTRETGASSAWTEGAAIYWDDTNKRVTKTVGSNLKIGVGVLPLPLDADAVGRVRLNASF